MVQGNITEADTPTLQMGATLSRLISDPPPSSAPTIFTLDALPVAILPLYPGLGALIAVINGMWALKLHPTHYFSS